MACLRLWQLEAALQQVEGFRQPQLALEQYVTPAHIAAPALHTAQLAHHDLAGRHVLDLGCGPGVLAVGAALLGAAHVLAVDCDCDALDVARDNIDAVLAERGAVVQLLQADVTTLADQLLLRSSPLPPLPLFDTVLTNPPFGTKRNVGVDMEFVRAALLLASRAVYSMHKRSARAAVLRRLQRWRCDRQARVVAELRYDLPRSYRFHRRHSVDVEVDLWRIAPPRSPELLSLLSADR